MLYPSTRQLAKREAQGMRSMLSPMIRLGMYATADLMTCTHVIHYKHLHLPLLYERRLFTIHCLSARVRSDQACSLEDSREARLPADVVARCPTSHGPLRMLHVVAS